MLQLNDPYPVLPEFQLYLRPYVLPLSLQEYWDNFYSDDGHYFYDKTVEARGEIVRSFTDWFKPTEAHY